MDKISFIIQFLITGRQYKHTQNSKLFQKELKGEGRLEEKNELKESEGICFI